MLVKEVVDLPPIGKPRDSLDAAIAGHIPDLRVVIKSSLKSGLEATVRHQSHLSAPHEQTTESRCFVGAETEAQSVRRQRQIGQQCPS